MKHDLPILVDWFKANKLTLHLGKTNFILFRPKTRNQNDINLSLRLGDAAIKREKVTKFLGIFLDEHLTFDSHVKNVCSKLAKNLYIMNSVKHFLPSHSMKLLYYSYIHRNITYGLNIWGPLVAKTCLKRVQTLQKKAIRAVDNARYNASTPTLFKKYEILTLDDLIDLECAKISYRFISSTLPRPVSSLFQANSHNHNYATRGRNNPRIEKHKGSTFNKSFLCKAPNTWASLPADMKNRPKLKSFSNNFKKTKFSSY